MKNKKKFAFGIILSFKFKGRAIWPFQGSFRVNDEAVCRTAPATLSLLNSLWVHPVLGSRVGIMRVTDQDQTKNDHLCVYIGLIQYLYQGQHLLALVPVLDP